MSAKTIVVLATLDTKGREAEYLRQQIEAYGDTALIVDTGVVGSPATRADITREEVADAGGMPLADILANPSREVAAPLGRPLAQACLRALDRRRKMPRTEAALGSRTRFSSSRWVTSRA